MKSVTLGDKKGPGAELDEICYSKGQKKKNEIEISQAQEILKELHKIKS